MAVFGNFKGTTQSDFKIGKTGVRIHGGISSPITNLSQGDIWLDGSNASISVYQGNSFVGIGATLSELNVDDGTLYVDNANDTVSIGSTISNEKLFVNGSIRLGTNPVINYSGAYLDLKHSNGTETVIRIRDNTGDTAPVFKVYSANNTSEVFKVQGNAVTVANSYVLPESDGAPGQAVITDGNGVLSFGSISATPGGSDTQIQFNNNGAFAGDANLTYDASNSTLNVTNLSYSNLLSDYGSIADSNVVIVDYGTVSEQTGFLVPGTYGNTSFAPVITVDAYGNITAITTTQITAATNISANTTDDLAEGVNNLYFSNTRINNVLTNYDGNITVSGTVTATALVETSSIEFKENINPITNAMALIQQLNGVTYDRKNKTKINEAGLLAEDVEKILPNLIGYDEFGKPVGIAYTKITAYLIEAVKELSEKIKYLESKSS
jgi:hypothetical protein